MSRVATTWAEVHASLWFLPAILTIVAILLALLTVHVDRVVLEASGLDELPWFAFAAGAEGARGVLGTIAAGIITVTGVVFSITIVALQLASTQYSPRVLRSFTEDRANQLVLGVFIGTFTYALMVLRTVRSAYEDYERFVPSISVNVAVLLALLSMGFLIFFVSHIARSIRAEAIIERVTRATRDSIDRLFPHELGDYADYDDAVTAQNTPPGMVRSARGGYLQAINQAALRELAEKRDLVLRTEREIGEFILVNDPIIAVWPAQAAEPAADSIRSAVTIGSERTPFQDIERLLIELTDIAIRALSPGVNDPTTAIVCIDRISELLAVLGTRRLAWTDDRGAARGRLFVRGPRFEQIVALSFGQLRHHGAADPAVAVRLIGALGRVASRVAAPRRQTLLAEIDEVINASRRCIESGRDLERLQQAAAEALKASATDSTDILQGGGA